jgi:23S rRNA G2445 N2-methylase RlmL
MEIKTRNGRKAKINIKRPAIRGISIETVEFNAEDIDAMYGAIGDRLKFHWPGFKAWIISSNPEAIKHIGLKSNHRHKVHNGPLECRWLGYDLYAGSRYADKT